MPYKNIKNLPASVQNSLPEHARDIYKEAFNHSWEEYKSPSKRRTKESLEEVAHKVVWAAVKKKYRKVGDTWKEREA